MFCTGTHSATARTVAQHTPIVLLLPFCTMLKHSVSTVMLRLLHTLGNLADALSMGNALSSSLGHSDVTCAEMLAPFAGYLFTSLRCGLGTCLSQAGTPVF